MLKELEGLIPEDIAKAEYWNNVKDLGDLANQFHNAQSLIGKPRIPDENADEETMNKFYKTIGRPDSPEEYGLVISEKDEDQKIFVTDLSKAMHKAGLTKKQVSEIVSTFDKGTKTLAEKKQKESEAKLQAEVEKANAELIAEYKELYGDKYEEKIGNADKLMGKYVNDKNKKYFEALDPEQKIVMSEVLNGVLQDYVKPEDINKFSSVGSSVPVISGKEYIAKNLEAYRDVNHPEHQSVRAKANEIYLQEQKNMKK